MASTLVKNVGKTPEPFLEVSQSCGWLSPRISFSLDEDDTKAPSSSLDDSSAGLFEFRPDDPVKSILPADQLISDGRLVPLQLPRTNSKEEEDDAGGGGERGITVAASDVRLVSSKAPSRWKELLGLKKATALHRRDKKASVAASNNPSPGVGALKQLLHRNSRSTPTDPSLSLPLLKRDPHEASQSVVAPCRPSLWDSNNKPTPPPPPPPQDAQISVRPKPKGSRRQMRAGVDAAVESPRMNSSGKVVFQNLGRSSSNPGSCNPRVKQRAMERSYSAASVRVTNVPVCKSVFRFGPLFSSHHKTNNNASRDRDRDHPIPGGNTANSRHQDDPIITSHHSMTD